MHDGELIDAADLQFDSLTSPAAEEAPAAPDPGPWNPMELAERSALLEALRKHAQRVDAAAASLGLSRATLYRKMSKYGIQNLKNENLSQK
jgi:transcriptional regulator of acetoin/glycerol metabolism